MDIGTHIGYYSLLAAKLMENSGKVYAFEPEPYNYNILTKNIEINGYRNIIPIKKAVSNNCGKTMLFIDSVHFSGHSICVTTGKENSIEVETTTLDDFFITWVRDTKVDLIKIE